MQKGARKHQTVPRLSETTVWQTLTGPHRLWGLRGLLRASPYDPSWHRSHAESCREKDQGGGAPSSEGRVEGRSKQVFLRVGPQLGASGPALAPR